MAYVNNTYVSKNKCYLSITDLIMVLTSEWRRGVCLIFLGPGKQASSMTGMCCLFQHDRFLLFTTTFDFLFPPISLLPCPDEKQFCDDAIWHQGISVKEAVTVKTCLLSHTSWSLYTEANYKLVERPWVENLYDSSWWTKMKTPLKGLMCLFCLDLNQASSLLLHSS